MSDTRTMIVDEGSAGLRLDAFVARAGVAVSAASARRAIAAGQVRVNGRLARKGDLLVAGQTVAVTIVAGEPLRSSPELAIQVLHEDEFLVAVDKPAGIPSHPLRPGEPGPSAAGAIAARFPECASASPDPREGGLVHRLDGGTSGVLVAARSKEAWEKLRRVMGGSGCEKEYLAEVIGTPVVPPPGADPFVRAAPDGAVVIDAPIGRTGRRGSKVRVGGTGRQPLEARTEVRLIEARGATTLVSARLKRGRAHQVRAHLAHLGTPVMGDVLYGHGEADGAPLRLHARSIVLQHPFTGAPLRIEAPLPQWARATR